MTRTSAWPAPLVRLACLITIVAGSAGRQAMAQSVFHGRVRADSSRAAIPFAIVEIRAASRSVQASISGIFSLSDLPEGAHAVVARAVGYEPLAITIEVGSHDTLEVDLLLRRSVTTLAPLEVIGKRAEPGGRMGGFAERRRAGFGRFFDRAALDRYGAGERLGTLLRHAAGVSAVMLPFPCRGFAAATGRGLGTIEMPSGMVCSLSFPPRPLGAACYLSVYIDGIRIWGWGDPDPPNIDEIDVRGLDGVEVYRGASEIPPEYQGTGGACGALLIWTRTG